MNLLFYPFSVALGFGEGLTGNEIADKFHYLSVITSMHYITKFSEIHNIVKKTDFYNMRPYRFFFYTSGFLCFGGFHYGFLYVGKKVGETWKNFEMK